jgi:hypothetical protein
MLTLFHTAQSNVALFDALLKEIAPDVPVRHVVNEDILQEARDAGAVTPRLIEQVDEAMAQVASDGSFVLCTCSTIGGLVEGNRPNVLRVDRPMAEKAVSLGSRIGVAATLRSTLEPTKALVRDAAQRVNKQVEITTLFLGAAWPIMERGDKDGYAREIAAQLAEACASQTLDAIVLAQASMAVAEPLCAHLPVPVLSSPRLGLEAALTQMK